MDAAGAGLSDSAVDERPVIEVRLGQDLALPLVLQHVGPRLVIALSIWWIRSQLRARRGPRRRHRRAAHDSADYFPRFQARVSVSPATFRY
jgi:hypothetical protein